MKDLMKAEPGATRSEALRRAVRAHVRRKQMDEFMALAGSRLVDISWQEMERLETAARPQPERRRGRRR